jgi:tripartite-type tricarboxylate transporter receptor subunit TctC
MYLADGNPARQWLQGRTTGESVRVGLASVLSIAALLLPSAAVIGAERFPVKPVRIVVPFPAGGSTDVIARQLAQQLTDMWGQPVIIDNRGGAGGVLGSEMVARTAPDGYATVMGSVSTHAIIPHINRKMPYDPIADFTAITEVARFPSMLVANPALPVRNVKELIALAKARPGELTFASNGTGTNSHLAGEMLQASAGIKLLHVPYKGAAPAISDVVAGHVAMLFTGVANGITQVRSGRLRPIAIAALERSPSLPEVPTLDQSGVHGVDVTIWLGLWGPAGMPADLVNRVQTDVASALRNPRMRELFAKQDAQAVGSTPPQFAARVREELARWGKVVRAANIQE